MLPILPNSTTITQDVHSKSNRKTDNKSRVRKAGLFVIILTIGFIVVTQATPLALSYFQGELSNIYGNATYVPVSNSFLQGLLSVQYSDPGDGYLATLVSTQQSEIKKPIDQDYSKPMSLTIDSAKINKVKISSNVPGSDKGLYETALKQGVAHLKGTSLPGDGGNPIIYGHSGIGGILVSPNNPQIIFSRLDGTQIGDRIVITRDEKNISYIVTAKKIIEPDNLSFITDASDKEKITLITCWPLGIGSKRLIVIADKTNE